MLRSFVMQATATKEVGMAALRETATGAAIQPYGSREETTEEFVAHVNRGKARALEAIGVDIVVGEREGPRFRDAFAGRTSRSLLSPVSGYEQSKAAGSTRLLSIAVYFAIAMLIVT